MGLFCVVSLFKYNARMQDILAKLFGSPHRAKLLRLFLFNQTNSFSVAEVSRRTRVPTTAVRRELELFSAIKLLKVRKRSSGYKSYILNTKFEYLEAIHALLLNLPLRSRMIVDRIKNIGAVKLIVLSGVFIDQNTGRVDLMVVGDNIAERKLKEAVRFVEAEIGKELRYVSMPTDEFKYRLNIYDKLVRDVIDYPHTVALDKLNLVLK